MGLPVSVRCGNKEAQYKYSQNTVSEGSFILVHRMDLSPLDFKINNISVEQMELTFLLKVYIFSYLFQ